MCIEELVGFFFRLPQGHQKYVYTRLNDCTSLDKKIKYNTWAVINKVRMQPFQTKTGKYMAQVFILDPDFKARCL